MLVLFFTYGQLYQYLEKTPILGISLGHHRFLLPAFALLAFLGLWWIIRRARDMESATAILNLTSAVLVVMAGAQIVGYQLQAARGGQAARSMAGAIEPLPVEPGRALPDVYYIILDGYARGDVLRRELGFDNTPFLDELQRMGFYVAECSRSNYASTNPSLASSLNFSYLPELHDVLAMQGIQTQDYRVLIKHSLVRSLLEQAGYTTVSFDTGYDWTTLSDAGLYLGEPGVPTELQSLAPFETMLIKSTAALALTEWMEMQEIARLDALNYPFAGHISRQLFLLSQLPLIPEYDRPTFTFAHILIPHVPYVFAPDGSIRTDPGFYGTDLAGAVNWEYFVEGYTGQIQFVNGRMVEILRMVLSTSDTPPIILLQGDHGFLGSGGPSGQASILSAYYVPDGVRRLLYPDITPVNSFRAVFDGFFGTDYGLLEDLVYSDEVAGPVPETSDACLCPAAR